MTLNPAQFAGYPMRHRPDLGDSAVGAHEAERIYPDIHEHPEYYTTGEEHDRETIPVLRRVRNMPDALVTVHRSAPAGSVIHPGDWVSLSRSYAAQHGRHPEDPNQDLPVFSMDVPAREVVEGSANSIHEWGWRPR